VPNLLFLGMAWDKDIEFACGTPPSYAKCLPADSLLSRDFMSQIDLLICPNWAAIENWPRVGLEAMHSGVPILADDAGGWREMVDPRCLVSRTQDYADAIVRLANDAAERRDIVDSNRKLLSRLNDYSTIVSLWRSAFNNLV
jgi:glycosyltransferase involved in cell wall biosynthesis